MAVPVTPVEIPSGDPLVHCPACGSAVASNGSACAHLVFVCFPFESSLSFSVPWVEALRERYEEAMASFDVALGGEPEALDQFIAAQCERTSLLVLQIVSRGSVQRTYAFDFHPDA